MSANPYGVSTIHETCQCGAKFDWQGDTWLGKCAVEKFRKDHLVCRETLSGTVKDGTLHWTDADGVEHSGPFVSEEPRT